jgi:hypothetical protein
MVTNQSPLVNVLETLLQIGIAQVMPVHQFLNLSASMGLARVLSLVLDRRMETAAHNMDIAAALLPTVGLDVNLLLGLVEYQAAALRPSHLPQQRRRRPQPAQRPQRLRPPPRSPPPPLPLSLLRLRLQLKAFQRMEPVHPLSPV